MPFPSRIALSSALLSLALTGASAPGFAAVVPRNLASISHAAAFAATQYSMPTVVTTSSQPLPGMVWPDTTPKVVDTYIATVLNISKTPCFDCVNGSTKGTFGSGYPLGYVNTNVLYMGILLEWFDVSFTGTCKVTITLSQAGKVLKTGSGSVNPTVGGIENSQLNVTRASTWHGAATMTGKVVCGTTTAQVKGIVHFQ